MSAGEPEERGATNSPLRVAVIGLGAMGLPMASRLATMFAVTGFDPAGPRRELATRSGIVAVTTAAAGCREADIALLSVRDRTQTETALFGADGVLTTLPPGSPIVLTSTVGPDAARELADKLDAEGYPLGRRPRQRRAGPGPRGRL